MSTLTKETVKALKGEQKRVQYVLKTAIAEAKSIEDKNIRKAVQLSLKELQGLMKPVAVDEA
mgnify:CR=1 FL=1